MTTLNEYFSSNRSYHPPPENNIITVRARIPPLFEDKVKRIIQVKGYTNYQDYFNTLFQKNKGLEDIIMPYEILRSIEDDYNSIEMGLIR